MWTRKIALAVFASSEALSRGKVRRAVASCAAALSAYGRLCDLARSRSTPSVEPTTRERFRQACRRALASLEPAPRAKRDPVRVLASIAKQMRERKHPRPRQAIDALDAVITAGHARGGTQLERRVVKQLARMLGARVLFHRKDGQYLHREAQTTHTLSSWTMLQLARHDGVRAWRIRRRPEFWRPEQRRPRGVLVFPIATGTACIARKFPFGRKELRAVRTVLRFLAAQTDTASAPPPIAPVEAEPRQARRRPRLEGLIGSSRPWRNVLEQVWRVAPADCAVLLHGETGTGKERLARAIHLASNRGKGPFVAVNCAAIHAETMQSELFGHIRGAFTGADRNRRGLIRQAHRGTLFLDELGDMPLEMQVALLRVLEERSVRPLGSSRERRADIRVVAATHQDLERMTHEGTFREDLYHRINVMTIQLPPLRVRLDDLPALARHILARTDETRTLHMDALPALARYDWPGNVRELENVLRAAILLSPDTVLGPEIIEQVLQGRGRTSATPTDRLAPRASAVMRILRGGWRSAPSLAEHLGISTRTMNRELSRLSNQGLIDTVGEARARRYRERRP